MDDDVQNLPIDIKIANLVDWLVSRQHTNKDWPETARLVREKINAAIQDMPEHPEITKLLSGSYINYFHCLKIVEILRETEADSKNILGWYTSQRMKDWQSLVKLYEKGGTCLAESSQLLYRYVVHELPFLKSQMARCVQIQQECDKKEADAHKSASNSRNLYLKQCKQIGIVGDSVRRELVGLVLELPAELDRIGQRVGGLRDAVQFYRDFVAFTSQGHFQDTLTMLSYLIEHGNVTTYEYRHGEPPLSVEDPNAALLEGVEDDTNAGDAAGGIDFGDGGADEGIDFGDDADGGIDFGDEGEGGIDFGDEGADAIDFGGDADGEQLGITVEASGVAGGVARGTEALTVLHNAATRDAILDDIYELEGFLRQRITEMSSPEDSMVALNLWDEAPKSLQMVSLDVLKEQLEQVQQLVNSLSTPKMLQLFLISASHRYVDRLTQNLQQQEKRSHVSPALLAALQEKRQQSAQQQHQLTRQVQQIKAATKILCGQLQQSISDKYKGRPVNIMGVMQGL